MKKSTKQRLIYIRYILPPILMVLTVLVMLIPAYRYVADGQVNETVSGVTLLNNAYDQAREVLFGAEDQRNADLIFSRLMLGLSIGSPLLYGLALAAAIYSCVVAIRYFASEDEEKAEKSRTLFITFFPNRIFLCIAEGLMLPMIIFPYLLPMIYKSIYGMNVVLLLRAPDGLIFGGLAFIATLALTVICSFMEKSFDADIFKKRDGFESEDSDEVESEDDYAPVVSREQHDGDDIAERNRRIRELLGKNEEQE